MATRVNHNPRDVTAFPTPRDAGLLGLELEIRATPTDQLAEMATLLIELPPALMDAAWPRLRLTLWVLQERIAETGVAA